MKERFEPRFRFCESGNHYHLLTGLGYGASPAFVSRDAAKEILAAATDKKDVQDIEDAARLEKELDGLKLRRGGCLGGLYARTQVMEYVSLSCWADFLRNSLPADEIIILAFFLHIPCDFVGKGLRDRESGGEELVFRAIKVSQVLALVSA